MSVGKHDEEELIKQIMSYNSEDEQSDSEIEKIEVPVGSELIKINSCFVLNKFLKVNVFK